MGRRVLGRRSGTWCGGGGVSGSATFHANHHVRGLLRVGSRCLHEHEQLLFRETTTQSPPREGCEGTPPPTTTQENNANKATASQQRVQAQEFTKGVVHMNPTDGSLVFTPDDMDKEEEVRGATPRAESEKSVRLRTLQIRDCVDPDTSSSHGPPTRKRRFGLALRAGDPESEFFRDWDIFTTFLLMFTALVTPFEVAFLDTDLRDDASPARALASITILAWRHSPALRGTAI